MWMLVKRCGELCVSHVRSLDYSRCKATDEQASTVAANGIYLTVELVKLDQAYPLPGLQCVCFCPRSVNPLG
jgi:hypothetical protein